LFRLWRNDKPTWGDQDRLLFLGGRHHPDLAELGPAHRLVEQPFRPWALTLESVGETVVGSVEEVSGEFAAALVLLGRHRDLNLGRMARAFRSVRPGGSVICCGETKEGGARYERLVRDAAGLLRQDVKHHCRVFEALAGTHVAEEQLADWAAAASPRELSDGFVVRAGIFGAKRVDHGTRLLLQHLPDRLEGDVADLGAGYGVLGCASAARGAGRVVAVEADALALACNRVNMSRHAPDVEATFQWEDALTWRPGRQFDWVVCNPPHHEGSRSDTDIGKGFIETASRILHPHGRMWMVANVRLPYEHTLSARFARWKPIAQGRGYKVIEARRPTLGR
jgi:16S rRNA (guanine1207-N2)-methyltransferase